MRYELPGFKPMPKKRPQGRTFHMPKDYLAWKQALRDELATRYNPLPVFGPVLLHIEIYAPNRPRGDRDNLAGGIMDALQPPRARGDVRAQRALEALTTIEERLEMAPGCLYADDAQVDDLRVRWVKSKERRLVIHLRELTEEQATKPDIG